MGNQPRGKTIKMMLNGQKIVAFYTIVTFVDVKSIIRQRVEDVTVYDMAGHNLVLSKEEMDQVRASCEKHFLYS